MKTDPTANQRKVLTKSEVPAENNTRSKCPDSIQRDPKFRIGQIVRCLEDWVQDKPLKIINYDAEDNTYQIEGLKPFWLEESQLEPYTEPETTRKDTQDLSLLDKQGDETKDTIEEKSYPPYLDRPKHIVPTMEEKKLNLAELLKGCEGEKFFSLHSGDVEYQGINGDGTLLFVKVNIDVYTCVTPEGFGAYGNAGICLIYPSRALYEKYPLDAKKAWDEWAEARKPKRWHPKNGEGFWCISPMLRPHYDAESNPGFDWKSDLNHFQTEEICQQAADGIREFLKTFHENNISK